MAYIRTRTQKDGSKAYDVEYRDPTGKVRSKSFPRKAEAKTFAAAVETAKAKGEWRDPKLGRTRFVTFAKEWLGTTVHLKPKTREGYEQLLKSHVLPYFGNAPLVEIRRTHVQKWVSKLQGEGLAAGTIRNAFRVLSKILAEAQQSHMIGANPASGIPLPKSAKHEMLILTPEEVSTLADMIHPRYRALVLFASYTGLRFGECAALRLENLDLLRGSVEVRASISEVAGNLHTVTPKTGQTRSVPLPRFLCASLTEHLALFASSSGYVFTSPEGGPLRKTFYRRYFKPAVRAAGVNPALRFHDLRHTAASIAIGAGANVKLVQQMLGHASATVTLDTYAHIFPSHQEELTARLDATYAGSNAPSAIQAPTGVSLIGG